MVRSHLQMHAFFVEGTEICMFHLGYDQLTRAKSVHMKIKIA